jgi:hypothetical protein
MMQNPNIWMASWRALAYQGNHYNDRQMMQNPNVQMASCRALGYQGKLYDDRDDAES